MSTDNTRRFSNRVDDYVKYRPHYPGEVLQYLQNLYGLTPVMQVADVGAGTGISSLLFLEAGYPVIAVEPNKEMREKAVMLLRHFSGFTAIDGTAEQTGLATGSIDVLIAGQAFHWFDPIQARAEFKRVITGKGIVVLLWNERQTVSAFEEEYDELIQKYAKEYQQLNHRNIDLEHIRAFYAPQSVSLECLEHKQVFDFEGLKGRLLSSSYMPLQGEPAYDLMIHDLEALFRRHQQEGAIAIHYTTKVYSGAFF